MAPTSELSTKYIFLLRSNGILAGITISADAVFAALFSGLSGRVVNDAFGLATIGVAFGVAIGVLSVAVGSAVSADVIANSGADGFAEDVVAVVDNELVSAFLLSLCSVVASAGDKRGEVRKEDCTNAVSVAA